MFSEVLVQFMLALFALLSFFGVELIPPETVADRTSTAVVRQIESEAIGTHDPVLLAA